MGGVDFIRRIAHGTKRRRPNDDDNDNYPSPNNERMQIDSYRPQSPDAGSVYSHRSSRSSLHGDNWSDDGTPVPGRYTSPSQLDSYRPSGPSRSRNPIAALRSVTSHHSLSSQGSANSQTSVISTLPRLGCRVYRQDEFKVGHIIRAPFHEQDFRDDGAPLGLHTTESKLGRIFSKFRPLLIVGLYKAHYIALPMYTHEGNGLARGHFNRDEWISLRYRDDKVEKQSDHEPLVVDWKHDWVFDFDPKSAAHLTAPVSRGYNQSCSIQGRLDKRSIYRLLQLYRDQTPDPALYQEYRLGFQEEVQVAVRSRHSR